MDRKAFHIGMFDSGMGGLTVFDAIKKKLPHENIIYFGDTARLPYGEKSPENVVRYSIENSIFLMEHNIKLLVVACNTAASVCMSKLRKIFNIPMIDVIEPGAEKAIEVSMTGRIGVLATRGTILSQAYQNLIVKLQPKARVTSIPCPLLVPLIEEGLFTHQATFTLLKDYLHPLLEQQVDTILLGCTHYPTLKNLIQEYVGHQVHVIDSAAACADKVALILSANTLHQTSPEMGATRFFVSDNPDKFLRLSKYFTDIELPEVNQIDVR